MPSPFTLVAEALQEIIQNEFSPEGFTAILDNLHESLGMNRVDIGIAPVADRLMSRNANVQETWVEVRFYDLWKQEIHPTTVVDPTRITDFAERFRNAVREANRGDLGFENAWYFSIESIDYPNDPTGNKSRFVATIRCYGTNSALAETGT